MFSCVCACVRVCVFSLLCLDRSLSLSLSLSLAVPFFFSLSLRPSRDYNHISALCERRRPRLSSSATGSGRRQASVNETLFLSYEVKEGEGGKGGKGGGERRERRGGGQCLHCCMSLPALSPPSPLPIREGGILSWR